MRLESDRDSESPEIEIHEVLSFISSWISNSQLLNSAASNPELYKARVHVDRVRGPESAHLSRLPLCCNATVAFLMPTILRVFSRCPPSIFQSSSHNQFFSRLSALAAQRTHPAQATPASRIGLISRHITSSSLSAASNMSRYTVRKVGAANTFEHRIYIERDGVVVSPFHDIPLYANEQQTVLNMVVEIPRWTNGKLEVSNGLIKAACRGIY